ETDAGSTAQRPFILNIEIDINGKADRSQSSYSGEGPEHRMLLRGERESGDDDRRLRGEHAEKKPRAAAVITVGHTVALAHLQFDQLGHGLIQARLGIVTSRAVTRPGSS